MTNAKSQIIIYIMHISIEKRWDKLKQYIKGFVSIRMQRWNLREGMQRHMWVLP